MTNNAFSRPATAAIHYELLHQTPLGPQHVTSSGTATLLIEEKLETSIANRSESWRYGADGSES
jgi:hypothetical protein